MERDIVSTAWKKQRTYPYDILTHRFDWEALEVGDHAIVRTRAVWRGARLSAARKAAHMTLTWTEIEPRIWRVERTA